jgi:hypothetical protein
VAVVAVDLCGELANRLDQIAYLGVRETVPLAPPSSEAASEPSRVAFCASVPQ